ncbi:MAG: PQQ-binding-like beta-propeller repeat protein [Candidatus Zixiibacteriota bacterium]
MSQSRFVISCMVAGLLLAGCSTQFRFKKEMLARPSAWQFPRGTIDGRGALESASFSGELKKVWEARLGDKPAGPLTVQNGLLVYASSRKRVRFFDTETGENLGMIRIKGVPQTGVVMTGTQAFVGVMPPQDKILGLDLWRRKVIWSFPIKDPAPGSIIVSNRLIISSVAGRVTALALENGHKDWQVDTEGRLLGQASANDSLIFQQTDRGDLMALAVSDGRQVWRTHLDGPCAGAVAVAGLLYVGDVLGNLLALTPDSGTIVWRVNVGSPMWGSPTVAGDRVVIGHSGGDLVALDSHTGEKIWTYSTLEVVKSSPIVVGQYVVAGTMGGKLVSLRLGDGTLVSQQQLTGAVQYGPVSDGRRILVATQSGRIVCFGESNDQLSQSHH